MRVDSDVVDKLIQKDETRESKLRTEQQEDLKSVFNVSVKSKEVYNVVFETLDENDAPVINNTVGIHAQDEGDVADWRRNEFLR